MLISRICCSATVLPNRQESALSCLNKNESISDFGAKTAVRAPACGWLKACSKSKQSEFKGAIV
jgi:hypothetical protein